jgi:AraC-like DNA-binding protein
MTAPPQHPHADEPTGPNWVRQAGVEVRLTQRGFEPLLGTAAGAMANQGVKLPDVLGPGGAELGGRLVEARSTAGRFAALDAALCRWMARDQAPRPEIAWAFRTLRRNPAQSVAALATEVGCSRKTLTAQFRARYGITPKTAARLSRFERVIAACTVRRLDWAAIAQDAGYFDQSHMIRDFTGFAGLTPAQYADRLAPDIGVIERTG